MAAINTSIRTQFGLEICSRAYSSPLGDRTPGVLLEERVVSFSWNYRSAGPYGSAQAKSLRSVLQNTIETESLELEIMDVNKAMDLRMKNVSIKRLLTEVIMKEYPQIDYALCVGDSGALPPAAPPGEGKPDIVKCLVGYKPEKREEAHLYLNDVEQVLGFLQMLLDLAPPDQPSEVLSKPAPPIVKAEASLSDHRPLRASDAQNV